MCTKKLTSNKLSLSLAAADQCLPFATKFTLHESCQEESSTSESTSQSRKNGSHTAVSNGVTHDECDSMFTSKATSSLLRKRKVHFWEWTDEPRLYNIAVVAENGRFVCVDDLQLSTGVIDSQNNPKFMFKLRHFKCYIDGAHGRSFRIGVTFQYTEKKTDYQICSQLERGKDVVLKEAYPILNPDERFFLQNETSSKYQVFESLLYLDYCLRFDDQTDDIAMTFYDVTSPFSTPHEPDLKFDSFRKYDGDIESRSGDESNVKKDKPKINIPLPWGGQRKGQNIPDKSELFKLLPVPTR